MSESDRKYPGPWWDVLSDDEKAEHVALADRLTAGLERQMADRAVDADTNP